MLRRGASLGNDLAEMLAISSWKPDYVFSMLVLLLLLRLLFLVLVLVLILRDEIAMAE